MAPLEKSQLRKRKNKLIGVLSYSLGLLVLVGCGVKGDPLPPINSDNLSKGRPTYKGKSRNTLLQNTNIFDEEENEKSEGGNE